MDTTVAIGHHEMLHEAAIGFSSKIGIVRVVESQSHTLQIGSDEDGRTGGLKIVGNGRRGVSVALVVAVGHEGAVMSQQLVPAACGIVPTGCDACCQQLQIAAKGLIVFRIFHASQLQLLEHIDEGEEIPGGGTSPVFCRVIDLSTCRSRDTSPL